MYVFWYGIYSILLEVGGLFAKVYDVGTGRCCDGIDPVWIEFVWICPVWIGLVSILAVWIVGDEIGCEIITGLVCWLVVIRLPPMCGEGILAVLKAGCRFGCGWGVVWW